MREEYKRLNKHSNDRNEDIGEEERVHSKESK